MKILHVISNLSPRSGGPTAALRALARYQVKAGLDITVCTTNSDGPAGGKINIELESTLLDNGVKYLYFPFVSPILLASSMRKWLIEHINNFDLIDIHGLYRFPVTYSAYLATNKTIPYVIRPHGSLDPYMYKQSRYNLPLKRLYERIFDLPNLNNASATLFTAKEEADRTGFLKLKARKYIVPNGIDWESYKSLPSKGEFRKSIGVDDQIPLVLFLGRINFVKGLDLLIPAFSHVVREVPSARLAIVGPDNEGYGSKVRQWCNEHRIQDKVFIIDILGSQEVKQAYVDADVFVLPSYTENFGMTVVEAMASNCPVVISDHVNIWREIQEEKAGIIVKLDPTSIAEAILFILNNQSEAKVMGNNGRIAAEKRYAWSKIADMLTVIYQNLIAESSI